MEEMEIFQNTLERFVKSEMILGASEEISWDYFRHVYGKLAELGFTDIIGQEELDRAPVLKNMARILTRSGNLAFALAILWQIAVNLLVLGNLEDTGKTKEDLANGITRGGVYVNWPWLNHSGSAALYPLTFGAPEEQYILLEAAGEQGFKLYLSSGLAQSGRYVERFAWSGLKEVRFGNGEGVAENGVYLGKLSQQGLEGVRALESFLLTACAVGLMDLAVRTGLEYAHERVQFGQKIWDFQVLKHYLADAYCKYQVVNGALDELSEYFSRVKEISGEGEVVKQVALNILQEITDIALQVHGGNGYMREFPVQRIWRDGMLLRLYVG